MNLRNELTKGRSKNSLIKTNRLNKPPSAPETRIESEKFDKQRKNCKRTDAGVRVRARVLEHARFTRTRACTPV